MDAAKAAVQDFMSKAGHHDTTVHEIISPAVTHETITRTEHEDVQTAIDKEIQQDHYHISVQYISEEATLPEQHHANVLPVEHRSFEHDNPEETHRTRAAEQAKFHDELHRVEAQRISSVSPVIAGERVHHHVHELIQPVVNKQTIEPHIIHTIVPIHEVHHNSAQHHATSALPAVSMADFKKHGGLLTGRDERNDGFEGDPREFGTVLGSQSSHNGPQTTTPSPSASASGPTAATTTTSTSGPTATAIASGPDAHRSSTSSAARTSLADKLKLDNNRDGKTTAAAPKAPAVTHETMQVKVTPTTAALARAGTIVAAGDFSLAEHLPGSGFRRDAPQQQPQHGAAAQSVPPHSRHVTPPAPGSRNPNGD